MTSTRVWWALAIAAAVPISTFAHSIGNEVGGGGSQATPLNPATSYVADQLNGTVNFSDAWSLRLNLGLTHDFPIAAPGQNLFPEQASGTNILTTGLLLDWTINDHYAVSGEFDYSPPSLQYSDTPLTIGSASGPGQMGNALLRSANQLIGGVLTFDANTGGDSAFESDGNVGAGVTQFTTHQSLPRIVTPTATYTPADLKADCSSGKVKPSTCKALGHAIRGETAALAQLRLFAGFTETFSLDTDATVSGAYYLYDSDPTQIGYFTNLIGGRFTGGGSLGSGLPLLPLLWSIRPEVAHRFGPVTVDLWYQFGQYYGADGFGHTVGLKVQWKITRAWRVYISGTGQDDVLPPDASATPPTTVATSTYSVTVAAGFKYRW